MDYIVGRIPGQATINPDAGGQGRQHKRGRSAQKTDADDSVDISAEAKRLSAHEDLPAEPEEPPAP